MLPHVLVATYEFLEYLLATYLPKIELLADISNDTLLHHAIEGGHTECVRTLLKFGVDPTAVRDYHPL